MRDALMSPQGTALLASEDMPGKVTLDACHAKFIYSHPIERA